MSIQSCINMWIVEYSKELYTWKFQMFEYFEILFQHFEYIAISDHFSAIRSTQISSDFSHTWIHRNPQTFQQSNNPGSSRSDDNSVQTIDPSENVENFLREWSWTQRVNLKFSYEWRIDIEVIGWICMVIERGLRVKRRVFAMSEDYSARNYSENFILLLSQSIDRLIPTRASN